MTQVYIQTLESGYAFSHAGGDAAHAQDESLTRSVGARETDTWGERKAWHELPLAVPSTPAREGERGTGWPGIEGGGGERPGAGHDARAQAS
jgi:hypothetical protein